MPLPFDTVVEVPAFSSPAAAADFPPAPPNDLWSWRLTPALSQGNSSRGVSVGGRAVPAMLCLVRQIVFVVKLRFFHDDFTFDEECDAIIVVPFKKPRIFSTFFRSPTVVACAVQYSTVCICVPTAQ